ncbi:hypothetical protein ACKWTF_015544 [Chironomus riparius]
MLKSTKHKKHHLRTKFQSKTQKVIKQATTEPTLALTDTNVTASEASHNLSDPQINETSTTSLPFFEESVLFEYKTKQYTKCIKTIERILKVTPKDQSSHYKILLAASNTMIGKKFKRSHNLLNEVLAKNPFDAYALYGKGVAFYFESKFDESIRYFDRAIDVNDEMEQAKEMRTRAQMKNMQVRVMLEKIKIEVGQKSEDENDEKSISSAIVKNEPEFKVDSSASTNQDRVTALEQVPSINCSTRKSKTAKLSKTEATNNDDQVISNGNESIEAEDKYSKIDSKTAPNNSRRSLRSSNGTPKPHPSLNQDPQSSSQEPQPNKFLSESFKQIASKSTIILESSSEDDLSDQQPTSSASSSAQLKFNKALDLYMIGQLERSLKYFQKSLKYEPDFEEADEMGTKAQEFIELLEVIEINIAEKNYAAVVEICTEGLEIDEGNDAVNRKILFHRGLAYFHLGEDEKSLEDYDEYERLGLKLEIIEDAK